MWRSDGRSYANDHRPQWNPEIVEDVPVTRYYCEYCAEAIDNKRNCERLLSAALCARNVLILLRDEVERLGCRAGNVRLKLDVAISEASGGRL